MFPNFHSQGAYNRNQSQELMIQILKTLIDIIKENQSYSLWILKQIEKNTPLFIDIIFRYGTTENELNDMAKLILEFFQLTFDFIYNYEKKNLDMTTDMEGLTLGAGLTLQRFKLGVAYGKYHVSSFSLLINAAFSF